MPKRVIKFLSFYYRTRVIKFALLVIIARAYY